MATLFNPKCGSNPSILSIVDMQNCSRLSLYIGVTMMCAIGIFLYLAHSEKVRMSDVLIMCVVSLVVAVCLTPLANLLGKRTKESQMIDEQGLVDAGVNPTSAKIASFSDQTIRRLGNTTSTSRSPSAQ